MKLYFYTNGGFGIGLGHIMRSLCLAQRLKNLGFKPAFISLNQNEFKEGHKLIKEAGFKLELIDDLKEITKANTLICDDCLLNAKDLTQLKEHFKKLVFVDDENELNFYNVDALINPNPYGKKFPYKSPKTTKFFFNISFLRDEFLKARKIKIKKKINNIFLTLGGSDDTNLTLKIIKELKSFLKKEKINLHIAVGRAFKYKKSLLKFKNKNVIFYKKAKMAFLMQKSDIGICGCGQSVYEFWSLGLPLISLVLAPNQQNLAEFAEKKDMLVYARDYKVIKKELLKMTYQKRLSLQKNIKKNFSYQKGLKEFVKWLKI
mgnify:FL=1